MLNLMFEEVIHFDLKGTILYLIKRFELMMFQLLSQICVIQNFGYGVVV
jgi:hypothetical protein